MVVCKVSTGIKTEVSAPDAAAAALQVQPRSEPTSGSRGKRSAISSSISKARVKKERNKNNKQISRAKTAWGNRIGMCGTYGLLGGEGRHMCHAVVDGHTHGKCHTLLHNSSLDLVLVQILSKVHNHIVTTLANVMHRGTDDAAVCYALDDLLTDGSRLLVLGDGVGVVDGGILLHLCDSFLALDLLGQPLEQGHLVGERVEVGRVLPQPELDVRGVRLLARRRPAAPLGAMPSGLIRLLPMATGRPGRR